MASAVSASYWAIAFAPSLPYMLLYAGYRKNLLHRRDALANLMSQKGVFDSYQARFGRAGDGREEIVGQLFDLYYRGSTYWLAIGMNAAVITLGVAIGIARLGVPIGPPELEALAGSAPVTLSMGFAGAYLLSLYDTLRRCRTGDLTAYSLHFTWVHMVLASILAALVGKAFQPGVAALVAFGLGLLPIKDTLDFVRAYIKKKMQIGTKDEAGGGPSLVLVQGLNNDVVDRLDEEGISSTVELAYYDPIKLFLKTNFQWAWVIDVIDQAILIKYVGESIKALRPVGIRGSIEMTVLGEPEPDERSAHDGVDQRVAIVAKRLGVTEQEARNLGKNLYEDGQVDLIWQLYKPYESQSDGKLESANGGKMVTPVADTEVASHS